jgi:predicted nucleic acid-binding protein
MNGEGRLFDTNILVHAYTISDERKHEIALTLIERVWEGEKAATALQNLCEFFFVVTRKGRQAFISSCRRNRVQRNHSGVSVGGH